MRPRKCRGEVRADMELSLLQWGRGLAAAEMTLNGTHASDFCVLQWGRGLAAAEIGDGGDLRVGGHLCFNGGRGLAAVEMS